MFNTKFTGGNGMIFTRFLQTWLDFLGLGVLESFGQVRGNGCLGAFENVGHAAVGVVTHATVKTEQVWGIYSGG
jgi:hypothetical protein